jgi:hypothetical protein
MPLIEKSASHRRRKAASVPTATGNSRANNARGPKTATVRMTAQARGGKRNQRMLAIVIPGAAAKSGLALYRRGVRS